MMSLKEKMEDIWKNYECAWPCHLAVWSEYGNMTRKRGQRFWTRLGLVWHRKGSPSPPIRRKSKQERWK